MSKNKKKTTKSVPRNSSVLSARSRVAGMTPMKSRNAPRGGNRNEQRELLEEAEEEVLFKEQTGETIMFREYDCISCDKPTREVSQTTNKCDECDIIYYGNTKFYDNEAERNIDEYQIVWCWDDCDRTKKNTILRKDKWFESVRQWYPNEIKRLDGWKLFDIRTKEQLEKLLVLI